MQYSKIRVSAVTTGKLRALQQRLGLTPNLLCRYALLTSLETGPIGNAPAPDEDGQEFNAYTLTGDQTQMLLAVVAFVESGGAAGKTPTPARTLELLRGHIHRGVGALAVRLKSTADLFRIAQ